MLTRPLVAATAVLATTLTTLPAAVSALGTNYNHDGETTYCWQIPHPPKLTKLNATDRVSGYSGKQDCPIIMTVSLSKYKALPFEVVNVTWTATADFTIRNLVNMTRVVYGPDSAGNPAQIVHSNVHSCVYGTGCDPFSDGDQLVDKTVNKIANFSDNHVRWVDSLRFPKTGDYSILAHIILPDANETNRFDYAVYAELVIQDATPAPATAAPVVTTATPTVDTSNGGGSGLSSAGTVGIIVGGVVVLALIAAIVVFQKRKRSAESPGASYMAPPAYDASVQLLGSGVGKRPNDADGRGPQSDCVTDTTTTAGFQSAWSGPAGERPSQSLDGTGASNASSNFSIDRESQGGVLNHSRGTAGGSAAMYRDGSLAASAATSNATQPRPRRVDSDVEL